EDARDAGALLARGVGKAPAQLAAARVDANLASRLGVDEPQLADVRELLFTGVADLDREDLVATEQLEQRAPPVERAPEVRDDHDDAPLSGVRSESRQRRPERRRAAAFLDRLALQRRQQPDEA